MLLLIVANVLFLFFLLAAAAFFCFIRNYKVGILSFSQVGGGKGASNNKIQNNPYIFQYSNIVSRTEGLVGRQLS